jgi:hypothetical protein
MAGTRWTWKQSVSVTRADTRVRKRRESPGLGRACLATEDMTEGAKRFEGRNKGAQFGLRSDGGNGTARHLPSLNDRPMMLSEPPSLIVLPPLRPQRPAAVSLASTPRVLSLGFSPSTDLRSERFPPSLWPIVRKKGFTRVWCLSTHRFSGSDCWGSLSRRRVHAGTRA